MKLLSKPSFGATLAASAFALLLFSGSRSYADTIYTFTGMSGGVAVSAKADFVITNGHIQVTLTSFEDNPTSDGQTLAGINFTTSNSPGTASLETSTGQLVDITSAGTINPFTGTITTHWGTGVGTGANSKTVCLEAAGGGTVSCAPGGKPFDTIVGDDGDHNFSNANGSLAGNHDPTIDGTGTFVLDLSGVNADTKINAVTFIFGTNGDTGTGTLSTPPPATPEPSSLLLAGTGLLGAAAALRRKMLGH